MTVQGRAEALVLLDTYSVAGTVLRHIKESAEESMGCFQLNSYWPLKSPRGSMQHLSTLGSLTKLAHTDCSPEQSAYSQAGKVNQIT